MRRSRRSRFAVWEDVPSLLEDQASIMMLPTRQDIAGTLVMIDKPGMMGKTLRQIADYAVMRAYAMTDPGRDRPSTDTILDLFASATPPPGLTSFDTDYLEALYRGPPNQTYSMMVGGMARRISADNRKQDAGAPH